MVKLIAIKISSSYGILSDQLFQFDPEITVDVLQNDGKNMVFLTENTDYIQNFFGKTVENVSGIVGKNGVGKSTTLRFIKELFIKDVNRNPIRNDIIIFKDNNTLHCYLNENAKNFVEIVNSTKYHHTCSYYRRSPKLYDLLKDTTTIFYSNSIDDEKRDIETTNFYNISTSFLKENIGKINRNLRNKRVRNQSRSRRFKITEFTRQIKLLRSTQHELSNLTVPFQNLADVKLDIYDIRASDYVQIKLIAQKIESRGNQKEERDRTINAILGKIDDIESLFKYEKKVGDFQSNIHGRVFECFIIYLLKTLLKNLDGDQIFYSATKGSLEFIFKVSSVGLDGENVRKQLNTLPRAITEGLKRDIPAFAKTKHVIDDILHSGKLALEFLDIIYRSEYNEGSLTINALSDDFSNFLHSYIQVNSEFNFVNFQWPELSAGEVSLLSFFSRIYNVFQDIKTANILLLIDEGDLYFHPEWQRDYLFYLIQFLETALPTRSRVSILLTTHSPFLLSDLPKENVILLKRDELRGKSKIVKSGEYLLDTFGGNIHTLFSTAFFMGESTVSAFAKKKIQTEIIDSIKNQTHSLDLQLTEKLIGKVGEPVLRSSLLELLKKRYDSL